MGFNYAIGSTCTQPGPGIKPRHSLKEQRLKMGHGMTCNVSNHISLPIYDNMRHSLSPRQLLDSCEREKERIIFYEP